MKTWIIIFTTFLITSTYSQQVEDKYLYQDANTSFQNQDFETAKKLYEKILLKDPDNRLARFRHARLYAWTKQYSTAEKLYQILLDRYPDDIEAYLGLYDVYNWQSKRDQGLLTLNKLLKAHPDNLPGLKKKITLTSRNGDWKIAKSTLKYALSKYPKDEELLKQNQLFKKIMGPELIVNVGTFEEADIEPDSRERIVTSAQDIYSGKIKQIWSQTHTSFFNFNWNKYSEKNNRTGTLNFFMQEFSGGLRHQGPMSKNLQWNMYSTVSLFKDKDSSSFVIGEDVLKYTYGLNIQFTNKNHRSIFFWDGYQRVLKNYENNELGFLKIQEWGIYYRWKTLKEIEFDVNLSAQWLDFENWKIHVQPRITYSPGILGSRLGLGYMVNKFKEDVANYYSYNIQNKPFLFLHLGNSPHKFLHVSGDFATHYSITNEELNPGINSTSANASVAKNKNLFAFEQDVRLTAVLNWKINLSTVSEGHIFHNPQDYWIFEVKLKNNWAF